MGEWRGEKRGRREGRKDVDKKRTCIQGDIEQRRGGGGGKGKKEKEERQNRGGVEWDRMIDRQIGT